MLWCSMLRETAEPHARQPFLLGGGVTMQNNCHHQCIGKRPLCLYRPVLTLMDVQPSSLASCSVMLGQQVMVVTQRPSFWVLTFVWPKYRQCFVTANISLLFHLCLIPCFYTVLICHPLTHLFPVHSQLYEASDTFDVSFWFGWCVGKRHAVW